MSDQLPPATEQDEINSALLVYKNLQITSNELINKMIGNHLGRANLGKVLQALLEDISYEPQRFVGRDTKKLYQVGQAILKAKEKIRADMRNKLLAGVEGVTDEAKDKILMEL